MQTQLSKFLNKIFKYTTLFALAFVWTNYYFTPLWVAVLLAGLFSIFCGLIMAYYSSKKQNLINLKKSEKKQASDSSFQFIFASNETVNNFFISLLKNTYEVDTKAGNIIIKQDNKTALFIPCYTSTTVSCKEVIDAYILAKQLSQTSVVIACKSLQEDCLQIAQSVKDATFTFLDETEVFKLFLQPYNTYPNFNIELKQVEKLKYSELKKYAFNKTKTKGYFLSGVMLMFASFFTRYNLYYVIVASLLFLSALYCMLSGNRKKEKKDIF